MKVKRLVIVTIALTGWSSPTQRAPAATFQLIHSIDLPNESRTSYDLAWDGQHLWTSMISIHGVAWNVTYALDPFDGSVISSFPFDGDLNRNGHTWDGNHLWITSNLANVDNVPHGSPPDVLPDHVYKFTTDGTLISTFRPPYDPDAITSGAAWDGTHLWLSDSKHREILRVDPLDMTIVTSFPSPGTLPRGLTWDGIWLWGVDGADDTVYQMDTSGHVVETWAAPGVDPYGVTFDGEYLWILDNDARKVFQLAIPEPSTLLLLGVAALVGPLSPGRHKDA